MKFMSDFKELEGKIYNSIDECKDAEAGILKQREDLSNQEREKSKLKKKLSAEIDKAEENLKIAYKEYDDAKEAARKILEESNNQMINILQPARDKVAAAEERKSEAIQKFNTECGVYQKVYTGAEAQAELERFNKNFRNIFVDFFKNWF